MCTQWIQQTISQSHEIISFMFAQLRERYRVRSPTSSHHWKFPFEFGTSKCRKQGHNIVSWQKLVTINVDIYAVPSIFSTCVRSILIGHLDDSIRTLVRVGKTAIPNITSGEPSVVSVDTFMPAYTALAVTFVAEAMVVVAAVATSTATTTPTGEDKPSCRSHLRSVVGWVGVEANRCVSDRAFPQIPVQFQAWVWRPASSPGTVMREKDEIRTRMLSFPFDWNWRETPPFFLLLAKCFIISNKYFPHLYSYICKHTYMRNYFI